MQNVTLPDRDEIGAVCDIPLKFLSCEMTSAAAADPVIAFGLVCGDIVQIKAFIQALYAKHGEDCPLFKEGE